MGPPLAKTSAPKLGQVLPRPRLISHLDALAQHKLIWIAAPAGSGKTTLAVQWLESYKRSFLWYQVDAGDQDIAACFDYLASSAERSSRLKRKLQRFTPEYALGLPAFSRNFFRNLFSRLKPPACLVFDNYQDVGEAALLDTVLAQALEELPEGITLLVLSRSAPPPTLARHEANGAIAHVDSETINLTAEEESALIKLTLGERKFKAGDLARLHSATHGWMAGLLLAVRSMRNRAAGEESEVIDTMLQAPAQDPAGTFDYFAAEVMARLDQATREFLYTAALFPDMRADLCEQLTGNSQAKAILQRLVREHFFTTRRGLLTTHYAFHPLFRQFLLLQGQQHFARAHWRSLQRQAGQLLVEVDEIDAAAGLLHDAQDWTSLAALIRNHGAEFEKKGRLSTLQQWITALPEALRQGEPWLLYWRGVAEIPTDPFASYSLFQQAYQLFQTHDDALGLYLSWNGVAMALFFCHDDMAPAPYWMAELESLRQRHPKWPNREIQVRVTMSAVGILLFGDTKNPALPEWVARAELLYRYVPIGMVRCYVGFQLGNYYSFYGQTIKMTNISHQLTPYIESAKVPDSARLLAASIPVCAGWHRGDFAFTDNAIESALELISTSGVTVTAAWFYAAAALYKFDQGDFELAIQYADMIRKHTLPSHRSEGIFLEVCAVKSAIQRGDLQSAKIAGDNALELARQVHNPMMLMMALVIRSQALIELGSYSEVQQMLEELRALSKEIHNHLFYYSHSLIKTYLLDHSRAPLPEILESLQDTFSTAIEHQLTHMMFVPPYIMSRLCTLALEHHIAPEFAKQLIRTYRYTASTNTPIENWPWPYRIYTLGRFGVVHNDKAIELDAKGNKKPLELLKTLIAFGGRDVPKNKLIEALWPDAEGDAGVQAFEITLHRLRTLLGKEAPLQLKGGMLTLDAKQCWVDVWAFERTASELEQTAEGVDQLQKVLHLYRGPFLAHEEELLAIIPQRERLRGRFLRALHSVETNTPTRVQIYSRALDVEPLAEELYQRLMNSHLEQGHFADGLAVYHRCSKALQAAVGVKPSHKTEALRTALEAAGKS